MCDPIWQMRGKVSLLRLLWIFCIIIRIIIWIKWIDVEKVFLKGRHYLNPCSGYLNQLANPTREQVASKFKPPLNFTFVLLTLLHSFYECSPKWGLIFTTWHQELLRLWKLGELGRQASRSTREQVSDRLGRDKSHWPSREYDRKVSLSLSLPFSTRVFCLVVNEDSTKEERNEDLLPICPTCCT